MQHVLEQKIDSSGLMQCNGLPFCLNILVLDRPNSFKSGGPPDLKDYLILKCLNKN